MARLGLSGVNMCREVEITRIVMTKIADRQSSEKQSNWCLELNYIDYTGESGSACIWLIGPVGEGDFLLRKGPLFGEKCVGVN